MKWSWRKISKTHEEDIDVMLIPTKQESPLLSEYNGHKNEYINYAKKLDHCIHKDNKEADELAKAVDGMFTYFINHYKGSHDISQIKYVVWIYFVACFWVIDKYCHDVYFSGGDISRITGVSLKDLNYAEITLLNIINFDIRQYWTECDE